MDPAEKAAALQQFAGQKTQVLISTTVIEVGVDVPNATVMVVEAAERFGLSQLHQLRGRVGRGAHQSFCYLMSSGWLATESFQRLSALERIHDGFKLSELDLEWRGAGELTGTKQTGMPDFSLGQLPRDLRLFQMARKDAFELLEKDPQLETVPRLSKRLESQMQNLRRS
jgi:ATP-dependent DNA helicase RecG